MRTRTVALLALAALAPTPVFAFDGCPGGTVNFTSSPDGTAYSAIFSAFQVLAGDSADCNLQVPITPIPVGGIGVFSADYRGAVTLADGETAVLTVAHNGVVDGKTETGPFDQGGYVIHQNVVLASPGSTIDSLITLDLTNASDPFSFGALDSVDYLELGRTTTASVQASLDMVSAGRTAVVARLNGAGALLLGWGQPLEGTNQVSLLGAIGSHEVGAAARLNVLPNVSVLGGVAWTEQSGPDSSVSGVLASGAIRVVQPDAAQARLFGEVGGSAGPALALSFDRSYSNGAPGGANITGRTSGSFAAAYVTGGVLLAPNADNEIVFSGTLMRDWLNVAGYSEPGAGNLFAATFAGSTNTFDTIKASAAWTTRFTTELDGTLSAGLGKTFSRDGTAATVAFVGPLSGAPQDDVFVEAGARLGWTFSPAAKLDGFVTAVSGTSSGAHVQVGTSLHVSF